MQTLFMSITKNVVLKHSSKITLGTGEGISYSVRVFRPYSRGYKGKKLYTNGPAQVLKLIYNSSLN